jgi:hypothetical protein
MTDGAISPGVVRKGMMRIARIHLLVAGINSPGSSIMTYRAARDIASVTVASATRQCRVRDSQIMVLSLVILTLGMTNLAIGISLGVSRVSQLGIYSDRIVTVATG